MINKYIQYLKYNPQKYWFKAKWYGWGWTPATWQGWLSTVVYISLLVAFSLTINDNSTDREVAFTFGLPATLLTVAFLWLAYKKGEKPGWHWGPPAMKK